MISARVHPGSAGATPRAIVLWLIVMAVPPLGSCGSSNEPSGPGSITLTVPELSPDGFQLTSVRLVVSGPALTTLTVEPGGQATMGGLSAGSYTVAVEGFVDEEIYGFGQVSDVVVAPGQDTRLSVPLDPFLTTMAPLEDTVRGKQLSFSFATVPFAREYEVRAFFLDPPSDLTDCCAPERTTGTFMTVPVPAYNLYVVLVRAFDPYGAPGRYSLPSEPVRVLPAIVPLLLCGAGGEADRSDRGFYIAHFPGVGLAQVDLYLSGDVAGTYDVSLVTRAATFEGSFIQAPAATVDLPGDSLAFQKVTFNYRPPSFDVRSPSLGETVTFELQGTGPGTLFFEVPHDDPACPVVETEDLTYPLSTLRRHGVHLMMTGGEP